MPLRLRLTDPAHGWVVLELRAAHATLSLDCSSVPADSIGDLARGLLTLLLARLPASVTVVLNHEPRETDLQLVLSSEGTLSLSASAFPDGRRAGRSPTVLFSCQGARNEIALSIWRALSDLQGRLPPQTYERSWGFPFPAKEVEQLRNVLKNTPRVNGRAPR